MKNQTILVIILLQIIFTIAMLYPFMREGIITNQLKKSTVKIRGIRGLSGTGSIINIGLYKYILTNAHVCRDDVFKLIEQEGREIGYYDIIYKDILKDLCLINGPVIIPPINIANHYDLGEKVFTIGYPSAEFSTSLKGNLIHKETVSFNNGPPPCEKLHFIQWLKDGPICLNEITVIISTIPTFHGQSGSAVVNKNGDLVGVIVGTQGELIPLETVQRFLTSFALR